MQKTDIIIWMQKHKEYEKNYQKMYCAKEKQELENIKK